MYGEHRHLDPQSEEYHYRGVLEFAPDTRQLSNANAMAYESLRADYLSLLGSGKIDAYENPAWHLDKPEARGSGNRPPLSSLIRLRLKLAKLLYGHGLSVNIDFAKLLTLVHKNELLDHRYIHDGFLGVIFGPDPRHRPLEGLASLAQASRKTQQVLRRLLGLFSEAMNHAQERAYALAKSAAANLGDAESKALWQELDAFEKTSGELWHRLHLAVEKLYRAIQYANDVMRDKASDYQSLQGVMADLGTGLRNSLEDVDAYRQARASGGPKWRLYEVHPGVYLSDPSRDLNEMFGEDGFHAFHTIYPELRGENDAKVYEMYEFTLWAQYVMAAGSIMAKIAELPEGRGGWADRLIQNARYRISRLQAPRPAAGNGTALAAIGGSAPLLPAKARKRDYASPALREHRESMEDRLWRIFFEHAGQPRETAPLLLSHPQDK